MRNLMQELFYNSFKTAPSCQVAAGDPSSQELRPELGMVRCGCRPWVPSHMPSHSTQCLWCRQSCSQSLLLLVGEMPARYPPTKQASSPGTHQLLGTSLTVLKCSSPVAVYKSNSRVSHALSFCIPLGWAPQAGTMSWQVPERSLSCLSPAPCYAQVGSSRRPNYSQACLLPDLA